MNCGHCQAPNPAGNAFCHACGTPLGKRAAAAPDAASDEHVCPSCGSPNPSHMQFCVRCGNDLKTEASTAIADPPTAASPTEAPATGAGPAGQTGAGGTPSGDGPTCAGCGQPLERGARFCKYCGSQVAAPAHEAGRASARVVVILRDGSEGGIYPLEQAQTDVGGREGDIVLPEDPYLSPRHARIARRGDTYALLDLGSVNGIYLRIRRPTPLSDADMILAGQQVLRFEVISEAERQVGPATQHGVMVFGTPEAPRAARLCQYTTEGLVRDVYYLHREETIMGREQADIVFSDDPFLSRRHASVTSQGGGFRISDLGSSNGTFLRCRGEHVLESGDQFRVGRHLFRFDLMAGAQ